jgi:hypothetical protein
MLFALPEICTIRTCPYSGTKSWSTKLVGTSGISKGIIYITQLVDDLAATFNLQRSDLNIVAQLFSLVTYALKFELGC